MARTALVSPEEVARALGAGEPLVVDLRQDPNDGLPTIPGSAWAGLHDGFAQARPELDLKYDLPRPAEFARAMSRLGVTNTTALVLADDMGNRWATRVYWLLRYFRHAGPVRVLDGGVKAYLAAGLPVADGFDTPARAAYDVTDDPDESIRATAEDLLAGIEAGSVTVCDVRTPQEFSGEVAMSGRGGHLPGAIHVPWDRCLGPDGRFLPDAELGQVLTAYLEGPGEPVTYCQGGIRASLTWFALQELLGMPARLYAASWEEWAQRPELPIVT